MTAHTTSGKRNSWQETRSERDAINNNSKIVIEQVSLREIPNCRYNLAIITKISAAKWRNETKSIDRVKNTEIKRKIKAGTGYMSTRAGKLLCRRWWVSLLD